MILTFVSGVAEAGVFGLGWVAFLWAMMQLRFERTRYQHLVIHIIEYFTKVSILRDLDSGLQSKPSDVSSFDDSIGRVLDSGRDASRRPAAKRGKAAS